MRFWMASASSTVFMPGAWRASSSWPKYEVLIPVPTDQGVVLQTQILARGRPGSDHPAVEVDVHHLGQPHPRVGLATEDRRTVGAMLTGGTIPVAHW